MLTVGIADFSVDNAAIRDVRFAVFVDEQRVPAEIEMDERDPQCVHVLALDGATPIGTGRIDLAKGGKIGRVAVVANARRRGVGNALMRELHAIAQARGLSTVWCNAQVAAVPFYEQLSYRADGVVFNEASIPHIRMELTL